MLSSCQTLTYLACIVSLYHKFNCMLGLFLYIISLTACSPECVTIYSLGIYMILEKHHVIRGQSPQNCTVRQCVTSKFDIKIFSKFIKIGFTTFKKNGISFKKTYRAISQTSMLCLASNSNF